MVALRVPALRRIDAPPERGAHVTVSLNGESTLTGHLFTFRAGSGGFYSRFGLAQKYHSFTVTRMSGNATTHAWADASDDLSCSEAAALLGIPPAALERWAQRLAFPHDVGGGGGGGASTRFRRAEIEALRDALVNSHSVEGAVRAARADVPGG